MPGFPPFYRVMFTVPVTFRCRLTRCLNFSCSHALAWRSRLWWPLRCSDILAAGLLVPSSSPITHPGIPLRLLLCSMLRVVTLKCSCGKHVCICVLHGIFYCLDACVAICKYPSSCVTEQKIKGDRGGNACLFLFGDLKACLPIFGTNL